MVGAYEPVCLMAYAAWPARVVFVAHSDVSTEANKRSLYRRFVSGVAKRNIRLRLDGLAAVSNYIRARQREWWGIAEHKTRTIYNGVDLSRFAPRKPGAASEDLTLFTAANLVAGKGLANLLRAVSNLRDSNVSLMIAGDGPEKESLKALAMSLNIQSRVSFLGLRNDIPDLLQRADIFAHPAIWAEAFPLSLVEAMAAECPVVASAIGGIPEAIEDGTTGVLVRPGDETDLTNALNLLIADPELRLRLGKAGRRRAVEHFNLSRCVEQHLDWCEQVMDSGQPRRNRTATLRGRTPPLQIPR
jgi:glycosyltransferase involved in cell wall biosynthesis